MASKSGSNAPSKSRGTSRGPRGRRPRGKKSPPTPSPATAVVTVRAQPARRVAQPPRQKQARPRPRKHQTDPHVSALNSRLTVARSVPGVQMSNSSPLYKFLHQTMLPDQACVTQCAVPPSLVSDPCVSFVKLSCNSSLDIYTHAAAFNAAQYPPALPTGAPVWNVGESLSLPVVQCQDPCFPIAMPLLSLPPPNIGSSFGRRFTVPIQDFLPHTGNPVVGYDEQYRFELVHTDLLSCTDSVFPDGFRRRPVFASRGLSDTSNYVWIDASETRPATVGVAGTLTCTWNNTSGVVVQVILHAERLSSDGSYDQESAQTTVAYAGATVGGASAYNTTINIGNSGYYRFFIGLQIAMNGGVPTQNLTMKSTGAIFSMIEYTDVGTAFYENTSYTQGITANGTNMWPLGVGTLFSFRANLLQNAGTIHAINVSASQMPMFYQATSTSRPSLSGTVPVDLQYNSGAGGKIENGLWAYSSPRVWLPKMAAVADSRLGGLSAPPLSYWPATTGNSVATNVVWFYPTSSSSTPQLMMTWTTYTLVAFSPRNQFISRMAFSMLTADNMDAARMLLVSMPNFSPNDWHSFFNSIASGASKVGDFLKRGATLVTQVAPHAIEAISHAATVAERVGAVAALFA